MDTFFVFFLTFAFIPGVTSLSTKAVCNGGQLKLYADGTLVGTHDGLSSDYGSFTLSDDAQVVGIECETIADVGGILAEVGDDYFTDATWHCSNRFQSDWSTASFDDSTWLYATPVTDNSDLSLFGPRTDFEDDVKWIWTSAYINGDWRVYCRGVINDVGAPDNMGRKFILAYMINSNWPSSAALADVELYVSTSSATSVSVRVTTPANTENSMNEKFTVTGGEVVDLTVPGGIIAADVELSNKAIQIMATGEVVAYGVNKQPFSNDAFLALPVDALGTEYYAVTWSHRDSERNLLLVGVYEGTTVSITFPAFFTGSVNAPGGQNYSAGQTLQITLNAYDTYSLEALSDLTGTHITSSRGLVFYSGNKKTTVDDGPADHLVEQIPPVSTWGVKFIITPIPTRTSGDEYIFVASEANTMITVRDGVSAEQISIDAAGEFYILHAPANMIATVVSNKPILVVQFQKSMHLRTEDGDPAMQIIPPVYLFTPDYTFATPQSATSFYTNYITLVVKESEKEGLRYNGGEIDQNLFTSVQGSATYIGDAFVTAQLRIGSTGTHRINHVSTAVSFGAYLYGFGDRETYATTAGYRLTPINQECVTSQGSAGDGIDNDCDGYIDEDDCSIQATYDCGDNHPCTTENINNGQFYFSHQDASRFVQCSESGQCFVMPCPAGTEWDQALLTCNHATPSDGDDENPRTDCAIPVPVNGGWSAWGDWGPCQQCGTTSSQSRSRTCSNPVPQHNGLPCSTTEAGITQTQSCTVNCDPVDGGFTAWSVWSDCDPYTCQELRTRSCSNPLPQFGGADCVGDWQESETCCEGACTSAPCQNGGTCSDGGGSYYECACADNYGGDDCETFTGLRVDFAVDNSIEVYADGQGMAMLSGWHNPASVVLPTNTGILAFEAHNSGGPAGILASLTNGMTTSDAWRCTTSEPTSSAWLNNGFDDSTWEVATEYGVNGVAPWGLIEGVAAGAKWIWTSDNTQVGHIFCRIRIGVEVLATCDNVIWVYADGVDYTISRSSTRNGDWTYSEYYILPRGTEVFGIKCRNAGGPAGILASVYNGPVTDVYNWKCTHDATEGWSTLGYDDSWWEIPTKVGDHGDSPWGNLQNPYPISWDADWIWTSSDVTDVVNYPIVYCRVSIETPTTCWQHHTDRNAVYDLIPSPRQENRPNTFYFGDMGDDIERCADACARESNCAAYTLALMAFNAMWAGQCYGRSSYIDTLVEETNVDCGVKVPCADIPTTGETVTECTGLPNGNYQSSTSCNEYINCWYGETTVHNCPENQYWDDELDRCDFVTTTCTDACSVGPCQHGGTCIYSGHRDSYTCACPTNVQGDNCETVTIPDGECVTDCSGVADGRYQSCQSCSVYAECVGGTLTDNIACPDGTSWDDEADGCVEQSTTCQDYCAVEVRLQCATGDQATCETLGCCWDAEQTPQCYHSSEPVVGPGGSLMCSEVPEEREECGYYGITREECLGYGCCWYTPDNYSPWCFHSQVAVGQTVSSCYGLANGNYQSSTNCQEYVSCTDGTQGMGACPQGQFWDDLRDGCYTRTGTCSDACSVAPCQNGGTCNYNGDAYTCTCAEYYEGPNCELFSGLRMDFAVDNSVEVWADGQSMVTLSGWHNPASVVLPINTGILAVQAHNSGGPAGFLASLTNGMVSNDEWRCTSSEPSSTAWRTGGFDDSSWEVATEYGPNGVSPWGLIPEVAGGAQWIWTSDNDQVGPVYCRIRIGMEVLGTCDDTVWIYADGIDYTTASISNSNREWTVSEYYILPRSTEVFGIRCQNTGGPAGILASVYNGPVTDVDHWKCTHTPGDGNDWSTLGYNDTDWEIATRVGGHGDDPWGNLQNPYPISWAADWIWTSSDVTDIVNYPIVYCRINIATPTTCWQSYTDMNSVLNLIPDSLEQDRPNTFFFGYMDDADQCADACARESLCAAYTLYLPTYGEPWSGRCYGRNNSVNHLLSDANIMTGIKTPCAEIPETGDRVSNCTGLPNGNYQSDGPCNEYITCTNGDMTINSCPDNQYWDDELERCDFETSTCTDACSVGPCQHGGTCIYSGDSYACLCPTNVHGVNCETVTVPTGQCVTDCSGVANGNYQSCQSCAVYVKCVDGALIDNNPCAGNLVWDDEESSCTSSSSTCTDYCAVESRSQCLPDILGQGECEFVGCCWETTVTPNCFHSLEPPASLNAPGSCTVESEERTDCGYMGMGREECLAYGCCYFTADPYWWCFHSNVNAQQPVTSCYGLADGSYHSPANCNEYIRCHSFILETVNCPEGLFFDASSNSCGEETSTCTDNCTSVPCQNGGTCHYHGDDSYTCTCVDGYEGEHCESGGIDSNENNNDNDDDDTGTDDTDDDDSMGGTDTLLTKKQKKKLKKIFSTTNLPAFLPMVAAAAVMGGLGARAAFMGFRWMVVKRKDRKREQEENSPPEAWQESTADMEAEIQAAPAPIPPPKRPIDNDW